MTQPAPYGGYTTVPPPKRPNLGILAFAIVVQLVVLVPIAGLLIADAHGDAEDARARVHEIQRQLDQQRSIADRARTERTRRDEVVETARRSAVQLFSYDYRSYDRYVTTATALSTDRFRPELTRTVEALRSQVISTRAVLKATVRDAAATSSDSPDTAVVLLFVDSTATTAGRPPRQTRTRVRLTLRQTGERWLVDGVQSV